MRTLWLTLILIGLASACTTLFPEKAPNARAPAGVKAVSLTIIAWERRCYPSVIAVDREGHSVLVSLTFRSEGKRHVILIPAFGIRRYLKPGEEATVEFLAERSGIYKFRCGRFPISLPFTWKGKIAIK